MFVREAMSACLARIISRATDDRFTLVFLLKAQPRAMGNTAGT